MSSIPQAFGKYQVLGPLGRGGMGEVYKAFQTDLHRHVAIKTMHVGGQAQAEFLERFQREARTAARLVHPNIVQIHDIGAEGGLQYIVMEYVEGLSLKQAMAEKKLDLRRALKIAYRVARTLQYAHEQKIIHRDIKPANVLIDRQGRVKVLDFGLAKSLAEGKGLTATGSMIGTPQYMAPEQAFGAPEEVDGRADLYSLGAVLYEMATGRPPFDGATVLAILRRIEEEDPAPPGISPAVDALLLKALAKEPEKRFQTAPEMAEAIKGCLSGDSAEPSGVEPPSGRFLAGRRLRAWWPAAALGLLAAAALVGWAVWPRPQPYVPETLAELKELLAEGGLKGLSDSDVLAYRKDPKLRETVTRQRIRRGQFSRAMADVEGYDRLICEIASAGTLQRFASPGLFRAWVKEPPGLKGHEVFLAAAFSRHQENRREAAWEKLKAAVAAGAPEPHVLLVRAHMDLWDVFPSPGGEGEKPVLAALRADLEKSEELFLLPLRAFAAHLEGDVPAAWKAADRLRDRAPHSAETWILRSILFLRDGRVDLSRDALGDAARLEPEHLETTFHGYYLRLIEVLNDPEGEALDTVGIRRDLDERLKAEHYPAALFLRGVLNALDSKWDRAEEDLKRLARRASLERIAVGHDLLAPFSRVAREPKCRLLLAARDLQDRLGRREAAVATALQVIGVGLPEEDRRQMLVENHRWLARALGADRAMALRHVEEALKRGASARDLREDEGLGDLRRDPAFEELLKRHE